MNRASVNAAKAEAQRFINRCDQLLITGVEEYHHDTGKRIVVPWRSYGAPAEQGAVKRASMDLTRSLAAMRKP